MSRKKKQEPSKDPGDRFESFDDIEDDDVVWADEEEWPADPAERPPRKAKGRGREKEVRPAPRRRALDDDYPDVG